MLLKTLPAKFNFFDQASMCKPKQQLYKSVSFLWAKMHAVMYSCFLTYKTGWVWDSDWNLNYMPNLKYDIG